MHGSQGSAEERCKWSEGGGAAQGGSEGRRGHSRRNRTPDTMSKNRGKCCKSAVRQRRQTAVTQENRDEHSTRREISRERRGTPEGQQELAKKKVDASTRSRASENRSPYKKCGTHVRSGPERRRVESQSEEVSRQREVGTSERAKSTGGREGTSGKQAGERRSCDKTRRKVEVKPKRAQYAESKRDITSRAERARSTAVDLQERARQRRKRTGRDGS
ncbi:hypothetical protein Tco_1244312 [Tanacetum coccineum]